MPNQFPSPHLTQRELNGLAFYLVHEGLIETEIIRTAIQTAKQQDMSLTYYLIKSNLLSSQALTNCCKKYFSLPFFDLKNYDVTLLTESPIHPELMYRYRVIPIYREGNTLTLGITDPTDHAAQRAISFHTGLHIRPMLVTEEDLDKLIHTHAQPALLGSHLENTLAKISPLDEEPVPELEPEEGPIGEFVDHLIQDAIEKKVSDIHIEPYAAGYRFRFRRDGLLNEVATIPFHLANRLITRLKILSHMNIAERRLPQDGRISLSSTLGIDIRASSCPTLLGEKIVLRLLSGKESNLNINNLGLTEKQKELFIAALMQPQGLILVTGPTGSGKTLTLYTLLHSLNQTEKNIASVEDPVEIELTGINQININPRIGLSFAAVLRALLRQDPDIIMLGEIRDEETAQMALQAAQTGHLVLSTLHTNNAVDALSRLQALGVDIHHIISGLTLVIAQRLVRKLCEQCKKPDSLPYPLYEETISSKFTTYRSIGCEYCYQGYSGRIGIFEVIAMTEERRTNLLTGITTKQLLINLKNEGHMFLWSAGIEKVKSGITSYAEVCRVVGNSF